MSLRAISYDVETVRRLCGPAVFARADALQRAGHVLGATWGDDGYTAEVRGVWRRVDSVTIQARGNRLHAVCTRDGSGVCAHAGAVLLQSLRDPASFTYTGTAEEDADDDDLIYERQTPAPESARVDELAGMLERETIGRLREIAGRRGIRPAGTKKSDLLAHLTPLLADPANIDAALARLTAEERMALDAAYLASGEQPAQPSAVSGVFAALGGTGAPALTAAVEAGLAFSSGQPGYPTGYAVPRAVGARLEPWQGVVQAAAIGEKTIGVGSTARLGMADLFQVIALDAAGSPFAFETYARTPAWLAGYAIFPRGFAAEAPETPSAGNNYAALQQGYPLVPRPLVPAAARQRLAARTGHSEDAVEFAISLMVSLNLAGAAPVFTPRPDQVQGFVNLDPVARLKRLVDRWSIVAGEAELALLVARDDRLSLLWRPLHAMMTDLTALAIGSAARLLLRIVSRLPLGTWFDLRSLVVAFAGIARVGSPRLSSIRTTRQGTSALSFEWQSASGKREGLALAAPEGWERFCGALVPMLVGGPLHWLGVVDAVVRPDRSGAVRLRPEAAAMLGRAVDPAALDDGARARLTVNDDLTVLAPPNLADATVHGRLARAGELIGASPDGLRYQLTGAGIQTLFDDGLSGADVRAFLEEHSGKKLPAPVTTALNRWWNGYGAVRLYDELALIELNDDFLLTELTAATSLRAALVHAFSPRLIAVDGARLDALLADLTARGYAPRVIEDA